MTHSQSSGPQPGQDDQGGALVSGVEFWDLSRPPTSDEAWTTHVYLYIYISRHDKIPNRGSSIDDQCRSMMFL